MEAPPSFEYRCMLEVSVCTYRRLHVHLCCHVAMWPCAFVLAWPCSCVLAPACMHKSVPIGAPYLYASAPMRFAPVPSCARVFLSLLALEFTTSLQLLQALCLLG